MKENFRVLTSCSVGLMLILAHGVSNGMPGMDMPSGASAQAPSLAKSIGAPINSDAAEFEMTYSADGKTVLFVSTRPGVIESKGNPYSFDIWMAHNVYGLLSFCKHVSHQDLGTTAHVYPVFIRAFTLTIMGYSHVCS